MASSLLRQNPDAGFIQGVRFAVVMCGGVQLAIYTNAVAKEMFKMTRVTPPRLDDRKQAHLADGRLRGRFRLALWSLLLLVFLSVTTAAQGDQPLACRCTPKSVATMPGQKLGFIAVRVKAQLNQTTNKLEWVLQEYPNETQINIEDAGLKEKIKNQIATLKSQRPSCGFSGNCRFDAFLNGQNDDIDLSVVLPPELSHPPTDPNQTFDCTLCVLYSAGAPTPARPFRVEIHVKTAMGATLTETHCATLGEAAARANRSGPARSLPVKLAFATEDLQNAKKDPRIITDEDARQRVMDELLQVADRAFDIAIAKKMIDADGKAMIGCVSDQAAQRIANDVITALKEIYDLHKYDNRVSWGRFFVSVFPCRSDSVCPSAPKSAGCDNLCGDSQQPAQQPSWIILISGLQIVRSVRIKAVPDEVDQQFTRTATGRSLYRKRKKAEAELNEKFRDSFAAKPGHIVNSQEVENDRRLILGEIEEFKGLRSRPYLPPDSTKRPDFTTNANLIYEALRKLPADRAIGLRGGGGYGPEEKFTANIGLDEQNMLSLGEQATLDFARGPETQKTRFTLSRTFAETGEAGFKLKAVSANVQYFRDNDQRLGNLTAEEIAARELGSQAKLSFGYDSYSAQDRLNEESVADERQRTHWTMLGDLTLEYRDVNIPASDRLLTITGLDRRLLPAARTQITNLALSITTGVTHDFRRPGRAGLGLIALSFSARLQRGISLFGADYKYGKALLSARSEVFFGRLTPRDFFLRYTNGLGRGASRTPVFELFRLGGPQNLRGIEEGELIGRRLSFGQAEFGVSAGSLWQFLHGRRATQSSPQAGASNASSNNSGSSAEEKSAGSGVDFSNVYLKTYFDHARITDPTSFVSIPSGAPSMLDRRANGYGFAVELRGLPAGNGGQRLNLSIGYGRSPQSRLHHSGTMFTAVTFNF